MADYEFDMQEALRRVVKYLIEGAAVAFAAYYFPKKKMNLEEITVIAITGAATFAVLDMFAPSISDAARKGAGFGIGATHVGFRGFGVI
jgi:hypothetical protein